MLRVLVKLWNIDRRIVSGLVLLVLALPLVVPMRLPIVVLPATEQLRRTIDAVPRDKLIVLAMDWDSSVQGECRPLTTALIDYLMRENRPFAIFALIAQGPELTESIAEELAVRNHKQYGEAWVNWGYRPNYQTTLIAMMNNLPDTIKTDIHQRPLSDYPLMKGVRSLKDVGLIYEVTGTGLLDVYVQFVGGVPLAQGCTAVIGPQQYPLLQSGQLKGLLVGLGGAAQFETLTGYRGPKGETGGEGIRRMGSQSLGHLLVMALIVLGNLGAWAAGQLAAKPGEETPRP